MDNLNYEGRQWKDKVAVDQHIVLPFKTRLKILFAPTLLTYNTIYSTKIIDGRQVMDTRLGCVTYWDMFKEKWDDLRRK